MDQQDQAPGDREAMPTQQQQQQQQPSSEGHAGQGSDSAMKQMRLWEQRRASESTRGKGPR